MPLYETTNDILCHAGLCIIAAALQFAKINGSSYLSHLHRSSVLPRDKNAAPPVYVRQKPNSTKVTVFFVGGLRSHEIHSTKCNSLTRQQVMPLLAIRCEKCILSPDCLFTIIVAIKRGMETKSIKLNPGYEALTCFFFSYGGRQRLSVRRFKVITHSFRTLNTTTLFCTQN